MVASLKLIPSDQKQFAYGVKCARKKAKLTQGELAQRIGVGLQAISHVELGDNMPSFPVYVELCRALGIKRLPLFKSLPITK